MKTKTVVCLSEYKKLHPLEKRMVRFFKDKIWPYATLPFVNFFAMYYSFSHHTIWYWVLFFVISFFTSLALLERYGNLSMEIRPEFNEREAVKKWAKKFIHGK